MNRKTELEMIANQVGFDRVLVERPKRDQYRVYVWDWNMPRMFTDKAGGWLSLIFDYVSFEEARQIIKQRAESVQSAFPGTKRLWE